MYNASRLELYRAILTGFAGLIFLGGCFIGMSVDSGISGFISLMLLIGTSAFFVLVYAEIIGLAMAMHDGLEHASYQMKQLSKVTGDEQSKPSMTFPSYGKSAVTDSTDAYKRGMMAYRQQRYQDAIKAFTAAIQKNENDRMAYYYRAQSYRYVGDTENAAADMKRYAEIKG
jgi:tetratricopeptide (TPR) repeat protein